MLKGCSRRELSARRRRQPCLANKFSTGKQRRERRHLQFPDQGKTSLDLKWGPSKLCDVTPKPLLPWLQPGAPAGACMAQHMHTSFGYMTPGEPCVCPRTWGWGRKPSSLSLDVALETPDAPFFSILFPRTGHHCCWELEHPYTGQDQTLCMWSDLERPCILCLGNQVQPFHCLPPRNSYRTRNESQVRRCCHIQAVKLVPPGWAAIPWQCPCASPCLETLAGKRPRIACL